VIGAERACVSGSTEGRAAAEEEGSPALRSSVSGGGTCNCSAQRASVARGDAVCVSDWTGEAVGGAADGEQGWRRRSGSGR
jgi:hypothetical protein